MSGRVGENPKRTALTGDGFIRAADRGYIEHTGRLHL